jgi:nitroimidazol reductase NimA-like FMN-containing flavoprotein (pyridoxamine 5'-phosphate oxidase superfamily)
MPVMSAEERTAFLTERGHMMRMGSTDDDGFPRVIPVWFLFRDEKIYFTLRSKSVFYHDLVRDPRVSLSIDESPLPYRKVTVQGTAEVVHPAGEDALWRVLYVEISARYVSPDNATAYVDGTAGQPRPLLAVDLAKSRMSTWRMPSEGEPASGVWAKRYYVAGTEDVLSGSSFRPADSPRSSS